MRLFLAFFCASIFSFTFAESSVLASTAEDLYIKVQGNPVICGTHARVEHLGQASPGIMLSRIVEREDLFGKKILLLEEKEDFLNFGEYTNRDGNKITIDNTTISDGTIVLHREAYTPAQDPSDYGFFQNSYLNMKAGNGKISVQWSLGSFEDVSLQCIYSLIDPAFKLIKNPGKHPDRTRNR